MTSPTSFDPLAILEALERHRVSFVLIGQLAGVVHGTDEIADSVDICPQMKLENLQRLAAALETIGVQVDATALQSEAFRVFESSVGQVIMVVQPAGTAGYNDLHRKATREPLGRGVRASVARVDDLARIVSAGDGQDRGHRLTVLRHVADQDLSRGISR